MGKYDFFLPDFDIIEKYFSNHPKSDKYEEFIDIFRDYAIDNGVIFNTNETSNRVELSSKNIIITLSLNEGGYITQAKVSGIGLFIKSVRDSIWETKTFFGVPVLSVINTSFDDETYWEDFPHMFTVIMASPEFINI